MNGDLRILIFHDSFDVLGGGEKVVATIAKAFDAKIATTNVDPEIVQDLGIKEDAIIDLGRISDRAPIGPIKSSLLFRRASFHEYETHLLSGFWSLYASYNHKPNVLYCHTPRRDFYDLKSFNIARQPNIIKKMVAWGWATGHAWFDKRAISQVNTILTNSRNVQTRIKRYYKRDSTVIYPPIATDRYYTKKYGDFWLSVNRLYPEKRVDLQVEIFESLQDENLVIVGGYSSRDKSLVNYHKLFTKLPKNVTIIGRIPEKQLLELYATCKGVVNIPIDEDFGLVPVEAQASGKAVVGVNEGGLKETVVSGKTGLLVDPNPKALGNAIKRVSEAPEQFQKACKRNAGRFDEKVFVRNVQRNLSRYSH